MCVSTFFLNDQKDLLPAALDSPKLPIAPVWISSPKIFATEKNLLQRKPQHVAAVLLEQFGRLSIIQEKQVPNVLRLVILLFWFGFVIISQISYQYKLALNHLPRIKNLILHFLCLSNCLGPCTTGIKSVSPCRAASSSISGCFTTSAEVFCTFLYCCLFCRDCPCFPGHAWMHTCICIM